MAFQFPPSSVRLHLSHVSMVLNEKEALREVTDDHQTRHATKMPDTCNFTTTGVLFSCPRQRLGKEPSHISVVQPCSGVHYPPQSCEGAFSKEGLSCMVGLVTRSFPFSVKHTSVPSLSYGLQITGPETAAFRY